MASRKKRSLDVAINLVPFIDLMSSLICFLIMTAVWNQIDRLEVSQAGGPSSSEQTPEESKTLPLNLQIKPDGFLVSTGAATYVVDSDNGRYVYCRKQNDTIDVDPTACEDSSLIGALRKVKSDATDQQNITVQCADGVPYRELVRVVDVCKMNSSTGKPLFFPEVAISAMDLN